MSRIKKLFSYQISDVQNNEERLQILGRSVAVYSKNLRVNSDSRPKTINFTQFKNISPTDSVYLVLQSMTFNLSKEVREGSRVYVLCPLNITTHRFILLFSDERTVRNFFSITLVANDLSSEIVCPTEWSDTEFLKQLHLF